MSASRAAAVARLSKISGIGPRLAGDLVRRGITTRPQLRRIIDELPLETQVNLRYPIERRVPLATVQSIVAELRRRATFVNAATGRRRRMPMVAVGSARRGAPCAHDIDILVVAPADVPLPKLLESIRLGGPRGLTLVETYSSGTRRLSAVIRRQAKYYAVDFFLTTAAEKPFALFHLTGSTQYNIRIRAHAKRKGYILNQYGLFYRAAPGRRVANTSAIKTEKDLAKFLGVTYRLPAQRDR